MMKTVLLKALFLFLITITTQAYATIMVGAKGGYLLWRPFIKDFPYDWAYTVNKGNGYMAGPLMSISLTDDFAVTLAAFFGQQRTSWNHITPEQTQIAFADYSMKAKRYDIDSAINYALTAYIKIFTGYKYQYFNVNIKESKIGYHDISTVNYISFSTFSYKTPSHGPALGVGLAYSLNETYFVTSNISFIYFINSKINADLDSIIIHYPGYTTPYLKLKFDLLQYGINVEPSIGAKIGQSLIVSVCPRFVWVRMKLKNNVIPIPIPTQTLYKKGDVWHDYIYGVFISAIYMI